MLSASVSIGPFFLQGVYSSYIMTTLLAIGDIHLGRLPAALPDELKARQRELGPETAWSRAVTEAINRKVDAVLLAGDVVERSRDFFVAYGQLKSGVEKLATAGIPVLAVAGNHDTHVLPRLASEIDSLHLLGAGGHWEQHDLGEIGVLGWSFPRPQVRHSPLDSLPTRKQKRPLIGLLHCDRDQSNSPYAPVSSSDLEAAPVAAWLLGHIHQPDRLDGKRPIGYLGSVSALRASETGARGPWLIRIEDNQVKASQIPLAPLRFESMSIDASTLQTADGLAELITAAVRERVTELEQSDYFPDVMGLRLVVSGQCNVSDQLPAAAASLLEDARSWQEGSIQCFVHRINIETMPHLDLESLARHADPVGLMARRLLDLAEPNTAQWQHLVALGRQRMEPVVAGREFRELDHSLSDQEIAERLTRAGRMALSQLIAQRELAG
jgi:DNA repair protein SbcD/Mre11